MSSEITTSIYARLSGAEVLTGTHLTAQTELAGLLAEDPDTRVGDVVGTGDPAVHFSNFSTVAPEEEGFPLITFRTSGGAPDFRFFDGVAMDFVEIDLEIWDNSQSSTMLTDIALRVMRLLDRRHGAPLFTLSGQRAFHMEAMTLPSILWDNQKHLQMLCQRFRMVQGMFYS